MSVLYDTADGPRALTASIKEALLRCRRSALGSFIPRDEDAGLLHNAGLASTPAHWWVTLNKYGCDALHRVRGGAV